MNRKKSDVLLNEINQLRIVLDRVVKIHEVDEPKKDKFWEMGECEPGKEAVELPTFLLRMYGELWKRTKDAPTDELIKISYALCELYKTLSS